MTASACQLQMNIVFFGLFIASTLQRACVIIVVTGNNRSHVARARYLGRKLNYTLGSLFPLLLQHGILSSLFLQLLAGLSL